MSELLKTCVICGQKKHLRAFLQINSAQGITYGTICADCRSKKANEADTAISRDAGGSTGTNAEKTIDSKAFKEIKAQEEKLRQLNKEVDDKERTVKEEKIIVEENKQTKLVATEKKYRSLFSERRTPPIDTSAQKTVTSAEKVQLKEPAPTKEPTPAEKVQPKQPTPTKEPLPTKETAPAKEPTPVKEAPPPREQTEHKEKPRSEEDVKRDSYNMQVASVVRNEGVAFKAFVRSGTVFGESVKKTDPTATTTEKDITDYINKTWFNNNR